MCFSVISRIAAGTVASDDSHVGLILFVYASIVLLLYMPLHVWRDHVLKPSGAALLLAYALSITAASALALQTVVTEMDNNAEGSMTCQFAVTTDQGETLTMGRASTRAAFFCM